MRTDTHRPSKIVPGEYAHVLSYNGATSEDGWPVPSYGINCELDRRITDKNGKIIKNGEHDPDGLCCVIGLLHHAKVKMIGNACKCTVCGTHFVYGEVWRHEPTGEHIHVGHICGRKYGLLADRSAFELAAGRHRAAAAVQVQRKVNREKRAAFLAEHDDLEDALAMDHHILRDMGARFQSRCELSEKQITLAHKIANELRNPKPEEAHVPAPISDGRQTIEGRIVGLKMHESEYGETLKMTVKIETEQGIWLAWGTCPKDLYDADRGDTVRFMAKLKPGRDAHFALFSRPTQSEIVTKAP